MSEPTTSRFPLSANADGELLPLEVNGNPLTYNGSELGGGGIPAGQVWLTTATGVTVYEQLVNTDAARGTALLTAVAAHVAGDRIEVGPGTYSVTRAPQTYDVVLTLLNGAKLIGHGATIKVGDLGATADPGWCIFAVGSTADASDQFGTQVTGFTFNCNVAGQTGNRAIGAVRLYGSNTLIANCRAINWGSKRSGGVECFAFGSGTYYGLGISYGAKIINCAVDTPAAVVHVDGTTGISIGGGALVDDGIFTPGDGWCYSPEISGCVVRNVTVGSGTSLPTYFHAYGLSYTYGASFHDNHALDISGGEGLYLDTGSISKAKIANNNFLNVNKGIYLRTSGTSITSKIDIIGTKIILTGANAAGINIEAEEGCSEQLRVLNSTIGEGGASGTRYGVIGSNVEGFQISGNIIEVGSNTTNAVKNSGDTCLNFTAHENYDSSGVPVGNIGAQTFSPYHVSTASAANDTLFYSTTSSRLAYKDDAATTHLVPGLGDVNTFSARQVIVGTPVSTAGVTALLTLTNDNTAYNASPFSGINFYTRYQSSSATTVMGAIGVGKSNATADNLESTMRFYIRQSPDDGSLHQVMHVDATGMVSCDFGGAGFAGEGMFLKSAGTKYLVLRDTETLNTANRYFTLIGGDADRTLTLSGNPTLGDWFDQSVKTTDKPTLNGLTISGNQSAAAWTTSGLRIVGVSGTLTDTSSSGTVAAAYTNKLGGNTIAASSATTFTNYISSYFSDPVAGTNVTLTNKYALGADSLRVGTSNALTVSLTGVLTATSPVFTTPTLGAATATTINGNAITTGTGTLTLGAGKTTTFDHTSTFTTTDSQTYAFPTTSATLARTDAANTFTGVQSFSGQIANSFSGTASTPALNVSGVPFAGTGTTSFPLVYIKDANATASTTLNTAGTYFGVNGDGAQDLMNLLKDGVSQFRVSSGGFVTSPGSLGLGTVGTVDPGAGYATVKGLNITASTDYTPSAGAGQITMSDGSSSIKVFIAQNGGGQVQLTSSGQYGFCTSSSAAGTTDVALARNGTNIAEINNGSAISGTSNAASIKALTFIPVGTATTCTGGTIGTGSKSNAGFVTATTTGTSTIVITFPVTAPTGWSIAASDSTAVTNMVQTASSTTTATLSGTTVTGDVIRYIAMAF